MWSSICVSSVSTPTVLSLDTNNILSCKSLRIVLDYCISASTEVHYTHISLCVQCSLGSAPFCLHQFLEVVSVHMEFPQFIIPLSTIVFHHQQIPQFVQPFPNRRAALHFPIFYHLKEHRYKYFCTVIFPMISLGYQPSSGMAGPKGRHSFNALWA